VRCPQLDLQKIGLGIGRALGKYPAAARVIEAKGQSDTATHTCGLCFFSNWKPGKKPICGVEPASRESTAKKPTPLVYPIGFFAPAQSRKPSSKKSITHCKPSSIFSKETKWAKHL